MLSPMSSKCGSNNIDSLIINNNKRGKKYLWSGVAALLLRGHHSSNNTTQQPEKKKKRFRFIHHTLPLPHNPQACPNRLHNTWHWHRRKISCATHTTMAKEWKTFGECLRDHAIFLGQLPYIMYAYVSMFDAKTVESIMLTVNSVNRCSYCTGLRELARLSGVRQKLGRHPCCVLLPKFCKNGWKRYSAEDAKVKDGDQSRVVALSYFLCWGSYGGIPSIHLYSAKAQACLICYLQCTTASCT